MSGQTWQLQIWPFYGYKSGLITTLHVRLFEPGYQANKGLASTVLILSAENRIRYRDQMVAQKIPYQIQYALPNTAGKIYYKGWKVDVRVRRSEILTKPVQISAWEKQRALNQTAYAVGQFGNQNIVGAFATGVMLAQAWNTFTLESKAAPVFRGLSLHLKISPMTTEDQENEKAIVASRKSPSPGSKSDWTVVGIIIAILIAVPVILIGACILLSLLQGLLNAVLTG